MMIESGTSAHRAGVVCIHIIAIGLMLACLLPLWNIIMISFSASEAVDANLVGLWPVRFSAQAYGKLLGDSQFWRSFLISVERVALTLGLNLVLVILMAYPLSKTNRQFKMRRFYMGIMIFAMLFSGGLIPSFLNIRRLGLLNSIWALVLPGAVPIFSVILLINFFRGIPKSLEEAAVIDGLNPLQIALRIFLPCSAAAVAVIALFSIVGTWNDFFSGLIYIRTKANYPLMTYIQSLNIDIAAIARTGDVNALKAAMEVSVRNLNAAKIAVAAIPLVCIYPFMQRYFITGIVMGSVKE
ncbi:MAG: carbohydrate ABC transporter permease [Treponema sp.]|nr:carbohydrate ABC transporter permease [Treponema sp.]